MIYKDSFDLCRNACINNYQCSAFSYNEEDGKCVIIAQKGAVSWIDQHFQSVSSWSSCGVVTSRIWIMKSRNNKLYFMQRNCDFNGFDIEEPHQEKSFDDCLIFCLNSSRCTHFSYHESGKCNVKNVSTPTDRVPATKDVTCGYISDPLNSVEWSVMGQIHWRDHCVFINAIYIGINTGITKADECGSICWNNSACTHFIHVGERCGLMFPRESTDSVESIPAIKDQFVCGYVPSRNWSESTDDHQVLVQSSCTFSSTSTDGRVLRSENSLSSCQKTCRSNYQCNAFSYDTANEGKCVINAPKGPQPWNDPHFHSSSYSLSSSCGVVTSRIWKSDTLDNQIYLWQRYCSFDESSDIEEARTVGNVHACISQCINNTKCTHFSFYENNATCHVKNAQALTDRVFTEDAIVCGYLHDRLITKYIFK